MANVVSMKLLLEAGVHFGHQTRRWDPRMRPYIFTERNGIHIIDLQQTVVKLNEAYSFVRDLVSGGGSLLFVGTKKQAQEAIELEAQRASMFYVNQRWLGGMLTNFATIQTRIKRLRELEASKESGDFETLPKKEAARLNDELARLLRLLGGIKEMRGLPDAIFIVDPHKERLAVAEAQRLDIPIISLCDTNCNPYEATYAIPANDDAIRAVKLLTSKIADAALEGLQMREKEDEAAESEKSTSGDFSEEDFLADAKPAEGEDEEEVAPTTEATSEVDEPAADESAADESEASQTEAAASTAEDVNIEHVPTAEEALAALTAQSERNAEDDAQA